MEGLLAELMEEDRMAAIRDAVMAAQEREEPGDAVGTDEDAISKWYNW